MIDLHCHSTSSDGVFDPIELLKKAEEEKLDYFSITDHDSISAYETLLNTNTKKYFSGKIIIGSEIRFIYNGIQLEVLGYGLNYEKMKNNFWVSKNATQVLKKAMYDLIIEKAKEIGFTYSHIDYDEKVKPERLLYSEILKHEENLPILNKYQIKHSGDFFRRLISNTQSPMYFDASKYSLTFEEAVKLIHENDGIAVLAHPFGVYNCSNPKDVLENLLSKNLLDGLECMHANMTPENTQYLLEKCKQYNLVSTGGSDFHGYQGQTFARANDGKDKIPNSLINSFLIAINQDNII